MKTQTASVTIVCTTSVSAGRTKTRSACFHSAISSGLFWILPLLAFAGHLAGQTNRVYVEFFVSPRGNDGWSGRELEPAGTNGPFATLERARDAVRALRRAQGAQVPARVTIRGGTYYRIQAVGYVGSRTTCVHDQRAGRCLEAAAKRNVKSS